MAAGSWFGLPELGISEKLGGNTSSLNRTILKPVVSSPMMPSVAGANNTREVVYGPEPAPAGYQPPSNQSSGGSSSSTPSQSSNNDFNNDFLKALENEYSNTMNYLGESEKNLRGQLPAAQGEVNSMVDANRTNLDVQKQASEAQLQQQSVEGQQRKESALDSARRLYNELMAGGQQRFGGASSAGEAYKTLGATELQRNSGQINQDYGNFMKQVEDQRTNVQNQYSAAVQSLEAQRTSMLNDVMRNFQASLNEINKARTEAGNNKEREKLLVLQDMRNQVYQINLARAQEQKNLDALLQQANTQIEDYVRQSYGAQQGFNQNTTTNPETGLGIENGGTTNDQVSYMGIRKPEDELFGQISRPRDRFQFAA